MGTDANFALGELYTWYNTNVISITVPKTSMVSVSRYRDLATLHTTSSSHLKFARKGFYHFSNSELTYYVSKATEFRPDIISVEMYNDPRYSWAILAANGMKSFFELTAEQYIMIPTLADVTRSLGV